MDRVDFVLSVSTKYTHKTTATLKRVKSITETESENLLVSRSQV